MDETILGKDEKMNLLHQHIDNLMVMLDAIDPEKAGVEDIDRIITKLDELEEQCKQYRREGNE